MASRVVTAKTRCAHCKTSLSRLLYREIHKDPVKRTGTAKLCPSCYAKHLEARGIKPGTDAEILNV